MPRYLRKPLIHRIHKKNLKFNLSFIFLCILAGIGSALFSLATDKAYYWCMIIYKNYSYLMIITTPIMFVIIVFLFKKYFSYAGGSGLPQGYALDVFDEEVLRSTYSIKAMVGKVILTFLSILSGAALGREGPTIQICASIFAMFKNISIERKNC